MEEYITETILYVILYAFVIVGLGLLFIGLMCLRLGLSHPKVWVGSPYAGPVLTALALFVLHLQPQPTLQWLVHCCCLLGNHHLISVGQKIIPEANFFFLWFLHDEHVFGVAETYFSLYKSVEKHKTNIFLSKS